MNQRNKTGLYLFIAFCAIILTSGCLTSAGFEHYEDNEMLATVPEGDIKVSGPLAYVKPQTENYDGSLFICNKMELDGAFTFYEKEFTEPIEKIMRFDYSSPKGKFKVILIDEYNNVTVLFDSEMKTDSGSLIFIPFEEGHQKIRIVGKNAVLENVVIDLN